MKFSPVLLCGVAAACLPACEIRPRGAANAAQNSAPVAASRAAVRAVSHLDGKAASHGCVRLTNWDAVQLSRAVEKGTKVIFVGEARSLAA